MPKVKKALASLQFVEKDSIQADITTHKVTFQVKDQPPFSMDEVKAALKEAGYDRANLLSGP